LNSTDGEVESWQPPASMWGTAAPGYGLFSFADAWKRREQIKRGNDLCDDLPCRLLCEKCASMNNGVVCVMVGNKKFIHKYRNTEDWFSHSFVNGFVALVQHDAHMTEPPYRNEHRVILVYKDYSQPFAMTSADIQTYGDATHMVSVAYSNSHFVVLYYDIHHRHVTVFDGLRMPITTWQKQIVDTLKGYGLQLPNAVCKSETKTGWEIVGGSSARQKEILVKLLFDDIRS